MCLILVLFFNIHKAVIIYSTLYSILLEMLFLYLFIIIMHNTFDILSNILNLF